jgi:hypothetical protein
VGHGMVKALGLLATALVIVPSGTCEGAVQCDPGPGQVAFFEHSDFGGRCVIRGVGNYPTASAIGLANDSISSIKVGANAQVFVCEHNSYKGDCELLTSNHSNLGIGNDRISSAKVQRRLRRQ